MKRFTRILLLLKRNQDKELLQKEDEEGLYYTNPDIVFRGSLRFLNPHNSLQFDCLSDNPQTVKFLGSSRLWEADEPKEALQNT